MTIKRTKTAHTAARAKRRLRPAAPKVVRTRSSDAGDTTAKPMLIGYARVSTVDQNLALQRDALTEAGCEKIFTEQMSGGVTDRPALHDALEFARSGDTVIVWKLDRLARSMKQLIETIENLRVRGIGFRSLTEALDTTTAQGRLVFHMFGALAEFERSLIRERTQAGLAAARRAGRTGGRPPKLTDDDIEAAKATLANPDIGVNQIAHRSASLPRRYIGTSPLHEARIPRKRSCPLVSTRTRSTRPQLLKARGSASATCFGAVYCTDRGGTFEKSGSRPSAIVGCAITASRSLEYGRSASIAVCTAAMT